MYYEDPELVSMLAHLVETSDASALFPIADCLQDLTGGDAPPEDSFSEILTLTQRALVAWKIFNARFVVASVYPIADIPQSYYETTLVASVKPGARKDTGYQHIIFRGLIANGLCASFGWEIPYAIPKGCKFDEVSAPLGCKWWIEFKSGNVGAFLERCIDEAPED